MMFWILSLLGSCLASELRPLMQTTAHDVYLENLSKVISPESGINHPSIDDFDLTNKRVFKVGKLDEDVSLSTAISQLSEDRCTLILDHGETQNNDKAIEITKTCFIQGKSTDTEYKIRETGPLGLFFVKSSTTAVSHLVFNFISTSSESAKVEDVELIDTSFATVNGQHAILSMNSLTFTSGLDMNKALKNSLVTLQTGALNIIGCTFSGFILSNSPLINLESTNGFTMERDSNNKLCEFKDITRLTGNGTVFSVSTNAGETFTLNNALFDHCTVKNGNGGAVYIQYNHGSVTLGNTMDTPLTLVFRECSAFTTADSVHTLINKEGKVVTNGFGGALYLAIFALPAADEHLNLTGIDFAQPGTAVDGRNVFVESKVDLSALSWLHQSLLRSNADSSTFAAHNTQHNSNILRTYGADWYTLWWIWFLIFFFAGDALALLLCCCCCGCTCCSLCCGCIFKGCRNCCRNCSCSCRRRRRRSYTYTPRTIETKPKSTNKPMQNNQQANTEQVTAVEAIPEEASSVETSTEQTSTTAEENEKPAQAEPTSEGIEAVPAEPAESTESTAYSAPAESAPAESAEPENVVSFPVKEENLQA